MESSGELWRALESFGELWRALELSEEKKVLEHSRNARKQYWNTVEMHTEKRWSRVEMHAEKCWSRVEMHANSAGIQ